MITNQNAGDNKRCELDLVLANYYDGTIKLIMKIKNLSYGEKKDLVRRFIPIAVILVVIETIAQMRAMGILAELIHIIFAIVGVFLLYLIFSKETKG